MTRDELIERVAADMWESRRDVDGVPAWADAGGFWQARFRELAAVAVRSVDDHRT